MGRGTVYRQGYLNSDKERTVRIRSTGDKAYVTIKGITVGASARSTSTRSPSRTQTP